MGPLFPWNDLHQIELNLDRIVILCQADPLTYSVDVCIDNNWRLAPSLNENTLSMLRAGFKILNLSEKEILALMRTVFLSRINYGIKFHSIWRSLT